MLAHPHEDEYTLSSPAGEAPSAPVVVYPVDDPTPIVRARVDASGPLMIAGDGEGLVDAADVGLLDGAGIIQYAGVVRHARGAARRARATTRCSC